MGKWVRTENEYFTEPIAGDRALFRMIYVQNGRDYPRLVISFYPGIDSLEKSIKISTSVKTAPEDWWEECGIPIELLSEVGEVLKQGVDRLEGD